MFIELCALVQNISTLIAEHHIISWSAPTRVRPHVGAETCSAIAYSAFVDRVRCLLPTRM